MNPQAQPSPTSRFATRHLAAAAALACGTLLAACGGGGSDGGSTTSTATSLSQPDATADAVNAESSGSDTASAMDTVVDTTTTLAQAAAQPASVASGRAQTQSAGASAAGVSIACAGGGTATLSITGGSASSELNGQLDAGEHYSVTYAQCTGRAGWTQLNGGVEMDVTSADDTTSPSSVAVSITITNLALSLPAGTETLNGTATVSRSVATNGSTTTTTSHVTVPGATLATAFNARNGSFTLSDLDATRTSTSVGGVVTASQYTGQHALSGTANGRSFSMTVSAKSALDYDATGALVSGAWTVVRPAATIAATVANGTVVITVDDGSDGTIDHTWTFPQAQLDTAAG